MRRSGRPPDVPQRSGLKMRRRSLPSARISQIQSGSSANRLEKAISWPSGAFVGREGVEFCGSLLLKTAMRLKPLPLGRTERIKLPGPLAPKDDAFAVRGPVRFCAQCEPTDPRSVRAHDVDARERKALWLRAVVASERNPSAVRRPSRALPPGQDAETSLPI